MRQKGTIGRSARRPPAAGVQQTPGFGGALAALAALGVGSALCALLLWAQLLIARSGGTLLCAAEEAAHRAAAWDSPFAAAIHRFTGLPLAGWGLMWGVAAFVFPLLSLLRLVQRKPVSHVVWAGRWLAVSGAAAVLVTIAVSVAERSFCAGCVILDALVLGYAGVALASWDRMNLREARHGLAWAVGANGIIFLLLLYPGLQTPSGAPREAAAAAFAGHSGTGDPDRDRQLIELVASLALKDRQRLSDSLYIYRASPQLALPSPRVLLGSSTAAAVRITEFTDVPCSRCASLHATLGSLRARLPPDSFSIEPRHYPLDTGCNPRARVRHGRSARCLAAAAQICLERDKRAFEFAGTLFEQQAGLTEEKVYDLAAPLLSRPDLERCVGSPETHAKLKDDLALAYRHHAEGPPLVLVNGRRGTSFGPFLHAMVLTRGVASHPAFEALPAPIPRVNFR